MPRVCTPFTFDRTDWRFDQTSWTWDMAQICVDVPESTSGSKGRKRKKIRGPYSDPRIFKAYIQRCIAERNAPRQDTQKAALQEALVHEVEQRRDADVITLDALVRENETLYALLAIETAKQARRALEARARQIEEQVSRLEAEEKRRRTIGLLTAMWDFLEQ